MAGIVTAGMVDQFRGDRLKPGGPAHRVVDATLRFYTRIGMGRRNSHVVALLTSNGGERRMMAVVVGITASLLLLSAEPILHAMKVEPDLIKPSMGYLHGIAAGMPAITLSTGNGSKITPVENGKI